MGMVSGITGKTWTASGCPGLQQVIRTGHSYWIMKSTIPAAQAAEISDSQNADQNQNAFSGDGQNMRKTLAICKELQKEGPHVKIGDVIRRYAVMSFTKINHSNVGAWAKYVMGQGAGVYVEEFLDWFSRFVNASELSCPPTWLEHLVTAIAHTFVIFRQTTTMVQYSGDGRVVNARPIPDNAAFILMTEVTAMGKNVPLCTMIEDFLRDLRVHVDPEIARVVGQSRARELVRHLELNATRMAFHKSLLPLFPVKSVGKVSPDKLHDMKVSWMRWVVDQNPQLLPVCEKCGISITDKVADKDEVWVCVCVCVRVRGFMRDIPTHK